MEIPLTFDAKFFDLLLEDVDSLDALQADQEKRLIEQIKELSTEVTAVTKYASLNVRRKHCRKSTSLIGK